MLNSCLYVDPQWDFQEAQIVLMPCVIDNWVFFNWNIKMFTLSSSSFIPDSDGGSHMETVRVITHTIWGEVSRRFKLWSLPNAQCSISRLTIVPEVQTLQGTQSLCWTGNLDHSFPTHNVNTPMLTFFRPLTPIPLFFVSCLIFGICGNVGNQTRVAAAAAEGGSRSAGTRGGEAAQSWLVMCDRADTDWVSKIMMFVVFTITTEVDGNLK